MSLDEKDIEETAEDIAKEVVEEEVSIEVEENKEENEIEKIKSECEEHKDKYRRLMAEFDNFRKRTTKEKSAIYDDAVVETIEKLLPAVDNLERALQSCSCEDGDNNISKGVEMVYKQINEIFLDIGVEIIKTKGEEFDPLYHNAVTHVEDESYGENEVVEEFQKGYIYKDKVVRHSMVRVAN